MTKLRLAQRFSNIILASESPRRADLLKQIGLEFHACPSGIIETHSARTSPAEVVEELARMKAQSVAQNLKQGLIIGADTTVVINREIVGKPKNNRHAVEILRRLSGIRHHVITGVTLLDIDRKQEIVWSESTLVHFRRLRESEILDYVESHEVLDKAGGYGIQDSAAAFVSRIEGCYFNVVGLPLARLVDNLWELAES
ncbi:MAG: Maf family protein [Candidatus Poribacteria bacterium]|nr:Maf family protein [Candidatus Poribacteria bacterium]MDE0504529.1 Maf family protein [Candidatus Poribacteria bacterium]